MYVLFISYFKFFLIFYSKLSGLGRGKEASTATATCRYKTQRSTSEGRIFCQISARRVFLLKGVCIIFLFIIFFILIFLLLLFVILFFLYLYIHIICIPPKGLPWTHPKGLVPSPRYKGLSPLLSWWSGIQLRCGYRWWN